MWGEWGIFCPTWRICEGMHRTAAIKGVRAGKQSRAAQKRSSAVPVGAGGAGTFWESSAPPAAEPELDSDAEGSEGMMTDLSLEERASLSTSAKAAAVIKKGLKEVAIMGRRARFAWRHLSAGVLIFQEARESGGGQRTFAIGRKLGEGGYSTIWSVHEWQPDGSERQFAVKRVILDRKDQEQVDVVEHESKVMRSLPPHPNLVELIGTCSRKQKGGGGGGSHEEVYMLLELCRGGSLADLLMARSAEGSPLSASEVARAFRDMAMALAHLHAQPQPLAHRDVKPENFILSDADGRWRLCDFGSATTETFAYQPGMPSHAVAAEEEKVHRYSTPQYRAPEMADPRRGETIGIGVDVMPSQCS